MKDDIATTTEIDDAIRFGFGLRWAQMGVFQVYRVAGGEAGMHHFMAQFGPALKWPWTNKGYQGRSHKLYLLSRNSD